MTNLLIYFVTAIVLLLLVAIKMMLNPKTKKKGSYVFSLIIVLIIIRYFSYNYTFDVDSFADSAGEDLTLILFFISMAAFAASPFAFLIGIFLTIKGGKYRKIGLFFMIGSIIAFIVGSSISSTLCGSGNLWTQKLF